MRRVSARRQLRVLRVAFPTTLAAALLLALPTATAAVPPAGPRLSFLEAEFVEKNVHSHVKVRLGRTALVSVDGEGRDRRSLLRAPSVAVRGPRVSWSADGNEFAFIGIPARLVRKEEESASGMGLPRGYVARADGTGLHVVAGTRGGSDPLLSPDGRWLAFTRERDHHPRIDPAKGADGILEALTHGYRSTSTWIVETLGGRPRRLTPWGNGRFSVPSSFSPDGSTLAVTVERIGAKSEVDTVALASGARRKLVGEAAEAAYSADGSEIAFVSNRDHESVPGFDRPEATSEIYVAAADGSDPHRVTHTPKLSESAPSWDPSGARLAYLRAPGGMFGLLERRVVESNADGTCPRVIAMLGPRRKRGEAVVGAPTWWAGADRGAGPLSC